MWTDRAKERYFDAVKEAALAGATPEELVKELEQNYYLAIDDIKKASVYTFNQLLKR